MANTFDWVEIRVGDVERAARFYEGLFGWKIAQKLAVEGSDYWIFESGGERRPENLSRGALWLRPDGRGLGVVVYVLVEDIEATLRKVVELGGKVVTPKTPEGSAFRAYFSDPSGNLLGLWEE